MRMKTRIATALARCAALLTCGLLTPGLVVTASLGAPDIPQYVRGPLSGFTHNCQEEKQKAPKPEAYLTSGDLDGDGLPDHIIDSGKGCAANRALYCNDEGCTIDIYASKISGLAGSFKGVRRWRISEIDAIGGRPDSLCSGRVFQVLTHRGHLCL